MAEPQTVTTAGGPALHERPRPRADAVRNRERIVATAREVFAERGPTAPLDEIARRAGVGNATLYRHFPARRSLLNAVLLSVVSRMADQVERAAADTTDAFAALEHFLHDAVDQRLGALCGLLLGKGEQFPSEPAAQYARVETAAAQLMDTAREDGRLLADVTFHDVLVTMSLVARPLPGTDHHDTDVHRRLQLLVNGLRLPTRGRARAPLTSHRDITNAGDAAAARRL
ncbi:TetR/AcrR family transcriptional regulator [Streptomyces sp. NBC_00510]